MLPEHIYNHIIITLLSAICILFLPWYIIFFVLLLSVRSYVVIIDYLRGNEEFMLFYNKNLSKLYSLYHIFMRRFSK